MRKPMPGAMVALLDVLAIGLALICFAYFHHVRPEKASGPLYSIVNQSTPAPTEAVETPFVTPLPDATPSPTPAPSPTPTPAPGDFSAAFEQNAVIDESALGSYASDTLRIVLTEHYSEKTEATYFVADVWVKTIWDFKTAFAKGAYGRGSYRYPYEIASENNAILAISGDCYGARSSGVVIRNGDLYRESVMQDVCILYADGVMETYYAEDFDLDAAVQRGAYQGWAFGPKLLDNGERADHYNTSSAIIGRNPRAAIGYYEPGHYCFVLVDGRQGGYSRGMTLDQLADLFLSLGCVDAYNLDGGQSAMMVFNGEIVGQPYKGGRAVSDIIYFERGADD